MEALGVRQHRNVSGRTVRFSPIMFKGLMEDFDPLVENERILSLYVRELDYGTYRSVPYQYCIRMWHSPSVLQLETVFAMTELR